MVCQPGRVCCCVTAKGKAFACFGDFGRDLDDRVCGFLHVAASDRSKLWWRLLWIPLVVLVDALVAFDDGSGSGCDGQTMFNKNPRNVLPGDLYHVSQCHFESLEPPVDLQISKIPRLVDDFIGQSPYAFL